MVLSLHNRQTQAWIASTAFHALLLLIFLLVGVNLERPVQSFVELLFLESAPLQSPGREEATAGVPIMTAPRQPEATTVVNLPKRKPLLPAPDEAIAVAARRDVDLPDIRPSRVVDRLARPGLERPPSRVGRPEGEKVIPPLTGNLRSALPPAVEAPIAGIADDRPFRIQWTGSNREIVRSILPEVPSGIEREVTLQFRFGVSPTGDVTAIRPLQKGAPALEAAALNALRQWKFQPLPPESPQQIQEAVITFRFRIRMRRLGGG